MGIYMKATLLRFVPLVAVAVILTGCAFTKETVTLNYQRPPLGEPVKEDATITVQKLKDARGSDPNLLAQKGIAGKTSGAYITSNEVAVTVTEALTDTLAGMGCKLVAEGGDLSIGGDLLKFDSNVLVGFWAGSMEGSIQLNLKLTNAKTGVQVWSDVVSGYSKIGGLQVDRAAHRTMVAEKALQDAMQKLAASESFRKVLTHYNASPPAPPPAP
jgi:PBP1b-binding outer membrane lipoprotein LpoB